MMDDLLREAKDKLLEASSPYIPSCAEDEQWCKYRDELCERIQQRLDTGGWIPVAKRLPEVGVSVLVSEPGRHVEKTCHDGRDWLLPHKSNVTHWQPLPALPKEK